MENFKRYMCSGCNFISGDRNVMNLHINKKIKCNNTTIPEIIDREYTFCKYCDMKIKSSTRIDYIKKHLENCVNYINHVKKEKFKKEEKERNKSIIIERIINYNRISIANNYNFMINSIYNPSIKHLGNDIEEIINIPLIELYKKVFFDINVPKNHSILYSKKEEQWGIIRVICEDDTNFYQPMNPNLLIFYNKITYALESLQNKLLNICPINGKEEELSNIRKLTQKETNNELLEMLKIAEDNSEMVKNTIYNNYKV